MGLRVCVGGHLRSKGRENLRLETGNWEKMKAWRAGGRKLTNY
jgi:hypothetical protein